MNVAAGKNLSDLSDIKTMHRIFIHLGLMMLVAAPALASTTDVRYPREINTPQGRLVVHAPQIKNWTGYELINAVAAIETTLPGMDSAALGTVRISANTITNLEEHTVTFYSLNINTVNFPQADKASNEELQAFVRTTLNKSKLTLPLEMVLQYLDEDIIPEGPKGLSMKPPEIFYATTDSRLLMFDGPPILSPINKTELEFAVNTNWDLFYVDSRASWYLLDGKRWLTMAGRELKGEWESVDELPKAFDKLPTTINWESVRAAIPPAANDAALPTIFISEVPAELILVEGKPKLEAIADTGISYVSNSDTDLFFYKKTYYYLVSGRWFTAKQLGTEWSPINKLPDAFADIPPDHPRGAVRVAVAGTNEAKIASLEAVIPRKAEVSRSYSPPVNISYSDGQPEFELIDSTSVYRAVNTEYSVLRVSQNFYLCYNAAWFASDEPGGPWKLADNIPQEIYSIPATSPAYNCTYVYVYDYNKDTVTTGYTSGYFNVYYSYGVPWYGTGWYYYPYYYGPYYYGHRGTYGSAAWYNSNNGNYGAGQRYVGPYGGASRVAVYNPETGAYARGRAVWNDDEIARQGLAYNPSTGTGVLTNRYANEDGSWGQSLIKRDDKWLATQGSRNGNSASVDFKTSGGASGSIDREMNDGTLSGSGEINRGDQTIDTEMRRSEDGVARKFTDEQGNTSGYVKNAEGDLYAGKDGEVYKREDGEWSKHGEEGWEPVEREQNTSSERAARQMDADLATARDRSNDTGGRAEGEYYDPSRANLPDFSDSGGALEGAGGLGAERDNRNRERQNFARQQPDNSRARQLDREHAARRQGQDRHVNRNRDMGARQGGARQGGGRRRR
jgi:hypothetical protein